MKVILSLSRQRHHMQCGTNVAKTRDMIYRSGADVKSISDELNSSGHASKNDLQLMMNLLKPRYVLPVQGEYRLLAANAHAATEVGIPAEKYLLASKRRCG